jgi:hypothetical protein
VLVLSPKGVERFRIEGYLPREEFRPGLEMGLARVAVMSKRWDEAERWYSHIVDGHADSSWCPEAIYWRGVSRYSASHDPAPLGQTAEELMQRFPESIWAKSASVWAAAPSPADRATLR